MSSEKLETIPALVPESAPPVRARAGLLDALLGTALFVAGLWCLRFQLEGLWIAWSHDALRSIGALIPPTSLFLALRAWKRTDWSESGNWWGIIPLSLALGLGIALGGGQVTTTLLMDSRVALINLVPVGVLVCAYASGAVLLLGGWRAWRAAAFPLLLLLGVNPIPRIFSVLDLPLQHLGAATARQFAALLQVPVSEGTLKMMFAPQLGMFIAPGCDGLRGAATMGYLALVIGYLYRLSGRRWTAFVAGAVVLAYVFNLLRLCAVVAYYWVALRVPALGHIGTEIDYAIGGVLFTLAAMFLFSLPRRWARM